MRGPSSARLETLPLPQQHLALHDRARAGARERIHHRRITDLRPRDEVVPARARAKRGQCEPFSIIPSDCLKTVQNSPSTSVFWPNKRGASTTALAPPCVIARHIPRVGGKLLY